MNDGWEGYSKQRLDRMLHDGDSFESTMYEVIPVGANW